MKEHLITNPLPNSYQLRCRNALERLDIIFAGCTGEDADMAREIFNQAKVELDILTWKADKQVQALKAKIQWLNHLYGE